MHDPYFPDLRADFKEMPLQSGGGGTNVFIRYFDTKHGSTPAYPTIMFENLKVSQQVLNGARGDSAFQLFLSLHVEDLGSGRYELTVPRAEIDAHIRINPRTHFKPLSEFQPIYDDFVASGGRDGGQAGRAVAERYLSGGGHWSTSFDGIRAKTMRHELDHVAFAIKECDGLIYNFINEARAHGKSTRDAGPRDRVEALLTLLLGDRGFPAFDTGSREHKEIAIRDFYFMVGCYETFILGLPEKSKVGYDAVVAARTNYKLLDAMRQLGEPPPWL